MCKVENLSKKYRVLASTLNKFVDADKTPTKKYLEFYLKTWKGKQKNHCPSINDLIDTVKKFDQLLPYIQNKDIYSAEYSDFRDLSMVVNEAEELKSEKTFDKNQHVKILYESEKYLFIIPLTHVGSIKYGFGTKWCTSSKKNTNFFKRYNDKGLLVYLIDKKNTKDSKYCKLAFFSPHKNYDNNSIIFVYDTLDKLVNESHLQKAGWDSDELFQFFTIFRYFFKQEKKIYLAKKNVNSFVKTISTLDFDQLKENLELLENKQINSYPSDIINIIDNFKNQINNFYADRTSQS